MNDGEPGVAVALGPIWTFATAVAAGAVVAAAGWMPADRGLGALLAATGLLLLAAAVATHPGRRSLVLLAAAGLLLAGGRGGWLAAERGDTAGLPRDAAVRARMQVLDGWQAARWGLRARVRLLGAERRGVPVTTPSTARLEVRGEATVAELPSPGATIAALVGARSTDRGLLLVASAPGLLDVVAPPRGLPAWRDRLATSLLAAAGADVDRIRSAELAAALALGRRDLLPRDRRDAWRRSGLAHVLAVSGLHVGLVGGAVWLAAAAAGVRPGRARAVTVAAIVGYAVLAGASPSAVRAAAMGAIVLGARSLGRAVLPMAAVLLAATALLLGDPALVADPGFQLTVVITAALVRWVQSAVEAAPLPTTLTGIVAVPAVAQLAAAPIVAGHFRVVTPGAAITNLAVPLLVTPTLAAALGAAVVAPWWPAAAGPMLEAVAWAERLLWTLGAPARGSAVLAPAVPAMLAAALAAAGWLALRPGRRALAGATVWVVLTAVVVSGWPWLQAPTGTAVDLLPVADGLAAVSFEDRSAVLLDGGRSTVAAARLLRDRGFRRLDAVIVSHADEDHVGGLPAVIGAFAPREVVLPAWMAAETAAAPVLRAARRSGARVRVVARGVAVELGTSTLEVVWPPATSPPREENERSIVARLRLGDSGVVLLTGDVGRDTELRLVRSTDLRCDVLLVPHHGSRRSASPEFLDAASPRVALIPAGSFNLHGHPAEEVLERLRARDIPYRAPAHHGRCGARRVDGRWTPYP